MRLSCAFLLLVLMDTGRGFRSLQHARGTLSRRRHASARAIANFEPQQMESLTDMPGAEYLADMPGASGDEVSVGRPLRVVVAGGGIGGLCAALVLKKQGFDVQVFEKAKEYKPFGGPIQIATNALESFRRIDVNVHARIMESATMIGDRKNGLKDGLSNEWFATFDLLTPAQDRGQEASVVIDRPTLQDILLSEVGDCVYTGVEVTGYEKQAADISAVVATLANGTRVEADLLVGSDGIWSKVRGQVRGKLEPPVWSGYTCFAAIANVVPDDIATVGYKVFLGSRKYFVSVDVGGGRIQWYAFLNLPPNSVKLESSEMCAWLKETQFSDWSEEVHQLLDNTPVEQVEQRDLYDRAPELQWATGRVCLLGDAAHPMMPNLGQGGGMAIEDALVLGQELRRIGDIDAVPLALTKYNRNRALRAAAVQGMSRVSSAFLFQYYHPTDVEWGDEGEWLPKRIKYFGPRSLITRAAQGFLQRVAFPLQFEFLFSFPGKVLDPQMFAAEQAGDFAARGGGMRLLTESKSKGPQRGAVEKGLFSGMSLQEWLNQYW